jgi:hypothetical protein
MINGIKIYVDAQAPNNHRSPQTVATYQVDSLDQLTPNVCKGIVGAHAQNFVGAYAYEIVDGKVGRKLGNVTRDGLQLSFA